MGLDIDSPAFMLSNLNHSESGILFQVIIASQEISATFKQHICDMQFNAVAVALKKLNCYKSI